jgi:hypothetical protein
MCYDPVQTYLPERYWGRKRDFFAYSVDFNQLAAGAPGQTEEIQVENRSDFLALSIAMTVADDTDIVEVGFAPFLIRVIDSSAGQNWQNRATHIQNMAQRMSDTSYGPYKLCQPRFWAAGTSITVELRNLDAANAFRVWFDFHGVKIYNTYRDE